MKQKVLFFFALLISFFTTRVEAQILTSTPAFPTQTDQITAIMMLQLETETFRAIPRFMHIQELSLVIA